MCVCVCVCVCMCLSMCREILEADVWCNKVKWKKEAAREGKRREEGVIEGRNERKEGRGAKERRWLWHGTGARQRGGVGVRVRYERKDQLRVEERRWGLRLSGSLHYADWNVVFKAYMIVLRQLLYRLFSTF